MDLPEWTKVLYNRIKKHEPENVSKILGYLLIQESNEYNIIRLSFCPDTLLNSLIIKAKIDLKLCPNTPSSSIFFNSPSSYYPFSANNSKFPTNYYPINHIISPKICHYFVKGFCKHGSSCRYFHGHTISNDFSNDENICSSESLEKLESELIELLKLRRGFPVSIASLPMLYYEKYEKSLQAEGYLTESQRQDKAGYSLTKLLARLRNSICLINRPHGQHSVILAEDVGKYMEFIGESYDQGGIISSSRQIYLTFPAECKFSEQDVAHYFNKFGHVWDVRIPGQQKRMHGFVTFTFPKTVRQILAKGNPHYVCGARILVKPYREKLNLVNGKYIEELQPAMYSAPQFALQPAMYSAPQFADSDLKSAEEIVFPNIEDFSYLLEVLNSGSNTDDTESSQGPGSN